MVGANPTAASDRRPAGQSEPDVGLRRGRGPLRHRRDPAGVVPAAPSASRSALPYLLGPIAAVVIGGASLTGGLASPLSTWVAAFFLAGLEPDDAGDGPADRAPVRGVRSRHHRRHVGVGRPHHPGCRARPSGAQANGGRRDTDRQHFQRRDAIEKGGTRIAGPSESTDGECHRPNGRGNMKRIKIIGIVATLAMVAAACSNGGDAGSAPAADRRCSDGSIRRRERAVGAVRREHERRPGAGDEGHGAGRLTCRTSSWPRSPARTRTSTRRRSTRRSSAGTRRSATPAPVATSSWATPTAAGSNVWRQVTRMEAILQALTYPEIGKMIFTDAQWNPDPAVAANDIRFLIQAGVSFIIGYPDQGTNIADADPGSEGRRDPVLHVLGGLGRTARSGGRARPRSGLPHGGRRGPLRARQELRRGDQRRASASGDGRPHGRHAGQRAVPRVAAAATCRRRLNPSIKTLGPADTYWVERRWRSRRSTAGSRRTRTSRGTPTSTPMGSTPP